MSMNHFSKPRGRPRFLPEPPYPTLIPSITPRRDTNRKSIGYLLISKDILDEICLTEELQATRFYTRSLIESNIDALMTTEPLGIITDVNQQMTALTGYGREASIGSPFKNYFTDPARAEERIRLLLREEKVTNYELTAFSKDGVRRSFPNNAATFFDRERKLQGVFANVVEYFLQIVKQ